MLGGTDWLVSRETGPIGTAVTGTSIAENGVPNRYTPPGDAVRHGEKAVLGPVWADLGPALL